jgi:hypothetical protein
MATPATHKAGVEATRTGGHPGDHRTRPLLSGYPQKPDSALILADLLCRV